MKDITITLVEQDLRAVAVLIAQTRVADCTTDEQALGLYKAYQVIKAALER